MQKRAMTIDAENALAIDSHIDAEKSPNDQCAYRCRKEP
jgi:hypothetical protein